MALTACIPNQAKQDFLNGVHAAADVYKMALFPAAGAVNLDASYVTYSSTGECANGNGYATGGATLSGYTPGLNGSTGYLDWTTDPTWPASTITARAAVIYNSSKSNKVLAILDFGADITSTNGTFTVQLPEPGVTAVIRMV